MSLLSLYSYAQLPAVITCWQQNSTNTGFGGILTNVQEVNYSATYVYVKTNDIPSWIPIGYNWPNNPWFPAAMSYQFRIRRNPIPNVGPETATGFGHIGLWKNGCSIYNPKDAKSYEDSSVWFQNAWYWEHLAGETFDHCIGHPNGSGEYHTHASPACLYDIEDSLQASPLIGYAFDGFPIYGGYGYSDPLDTTSSIARLRSGYRLRSITDRIVLPDSTVLQPIHYGPSLNSIPLGGYMEDYEFVPGLGDLDIHNGRFCITKEYPTGTYAYFTTLAWVNDTFGYGIKPIFPFVIGTTYYGEVYPADGNTGPGSGFVVIAEPVTQYVDSTSTVHELNDNINFQLFPNPANNQFHFQLDAKDHSETYVGTIYSVNGDEIEQVVVVPGNMYLYDANRLSNGIYFLKIVTSKNAYSYKFIVAK